MDLTGTKPIIISAGISGWYKAGIDRLENSLMFNGYAGQTMFWRDQYPEGSPSHADNPYAFKIFAFKEAFNKSRIALWLDASFWCIKTPHVLFDIISDHGIFAFKTGYNCAQTCTDAALAWAGFTRDEAELLPEIASGAVGLNVDNPEGAAVFYCWQDGMEKGLFKNNRLHDTADSQDKRFLHGRQDQSILSLVIHKLGITFDYQDYVAYYGSGYNKEKCLFFINGL